jgi:large subunit ribosomal protein L31e
MAKQKTIPTEREYIVPLKKETNKVQIHKRTPKAIKALKQFIARHMRVPERDTSKVKLDKWLNKEIWFRGIKSPPAKIKVKATKKGENVYVELVDIPDKIKFAKAREEKQRKESEKKVKEKKEKQPKEEKTKEEEKKEEEKEKSVKEFDQEKSQQKAKEAKHTQIEKHQTKTPKRKTPATR